MGAVGRARAAVQGGRVDDVHIEQSEPDDGTYYVDDCIEGSNFVEMDLLHSGTVDLGLGGCQAREYVLGDTLHLLVEVAGFQEGDDVAQVPGRRHGSQG